MVKKVKEGNKGERKGLKREREKQLGWVLLVLVHHYTFGVGGCFLYIYIYIC